MARDESLVVYPVARSRHSEIRVALLRRHGALVGDVRVFEQRPGVAELQPTSRGLAVPLTALPLLRDALCQLAELAVKAADESPT